MFVRLFGKSSGYQFATGPEGNPVPSRWRDVEEPARAPGQLVPRGAQHVERELANGREVVRDDRHAVERARELVHEHCPDVALGRPALAQPLERDPRTVFTFAGHGAHQLAGVMHAEVRVAREHQLDHGRERALRAQALVEPEARTELGRIRTHQVDAE